MTAAVFVGTSIAPGEVQPDRSKIMAIVNWKTLKDAMNLAAFLGLTKGSVI